MPGELAPCPDEGCTDSRRARLLGSRCPRPWLIAHIDDIKGPVHDALPCRRRLGLAPSPCISRRFWAHFSDESVRPLRARHHPRHSCLPPTCFARRESCSLLAGTPTRHPDDESFAAHNQPPIKLSRHCHGNIFAFPASSAERSPCARGTGDWRPESVSWRHPSARARVCGRLGPHFFSARNAT